MGLLVRILRLITGPPPVTQADEARWHRRYWTFIGFAQLAVLAVWTWVFLHWNLHFGVGIDFVLFLGAINALRRAGEEG